MLEALDASQRAQRQLVADASHELRTPLTSLRTNLEVLGSNGKLEAADRERLRRDLVAQLEELGELVGDLVELARDGEAPSEPLEPVRLDELVAAAVERAQRHAPEVVFAAELESCVVAGERARLDRAVANLLDNAAQVEPARQHGRGATARRRADRARPRAGDRARGPPARVRPLLPRDGGTRPGGSGTRPGDRAARRRAARRDRRRRGGAGRRRAAAAGAAGLSSDSYLTRNRFSFRRGSIRGMRIHTLIAALLTTSALALAACGDGSTTAATRRADRQNEMR